MREAKCAASFILLWVCSAERASAESTCSGCSSVHLIATWVRSVDWKDRAVLLAPKGSPFFSSCTVLALRQVIWRGCAAQYIFQRKLHPACSSYFHLQCSPPSLLLSFCFARSRLLAAGAICSPCPCCYHHNVSEADIFQTLSLVWLFFSDKSHNKFFLEQFAKNVWCRKYETVKTQMQINVKFIFEISSQSSLVKNGLIQVSFVTRWWMKH